MISQNDLREIIRLQREWILNLDEGVKRERLLSISIREGFALIISGVRRCGKSTLLSQLVRRQKAFYYLNLEDPRLVGFSLSDFTMADAIFKEDYGVEGVYFFDEIQNIDQWEKFIRFLVDRKERVVITGSNASLLSRELGTKLTGRHVDVQLLPFSYNEFLHFYAMAASARSYEEYSIKGGFPEYLRSNNPLILNELLNDIVMRDVVTRFGIRNSLLLKRMAIYLISHVGKAFSFNSLRKIFQVKSLQTVIDYVSFFEDSYLLFTVPKFDYSYQKQLVNPKKVYSIDNGLSTINSVSFSKDKGRMLENSVFLHLTGKYRGIYYFQEEHECDFVLKEGDRAIEAVQVCWELHDGNRDREIRGLIEAMTKLKLQQGVIVTYNQADTYAVDGKDISVVPVWKWIT